jgi:hypothetical protein
MRNVLVYAYPANVSTSTIPEGSGRPKEECQVECRKEVNEIDMVWSRKKKGVMPDTKKK